MTVTRINQFEAKPGRGAELRHLLSSMIDTILCSPGCRSCELLQAVDQVERLSVLEVWDRIEAHQGAARAIPTSKLEEAMALLATSPTGAYFRPAGDAGPEAADPHGRDRTSRP
jgi:quinol monooxygenase YgiN